MIRILLLGKVGQLGWELRRTLAPLGQVTSLDYPEIDLSQPEKLPALVREISPQVLINATAYTAVDRAENEVELAMQINGEAPGILAEIAKMIDAVLIHYSTDYVFDGEKGQPYTELDTPNPLGVYGRSKLAGEQAIVQSNGSYLILRTSWLYSTRRESFVTKVLEWANNNEAIRVVTDQIGNPTWSRLLAEITAQLLGKAIAEAGDDLLDWVLDRRGIYHLAGDGFASRFEWAQAILAFSEQWRDGDRARSVPQILPARTSDFPTPARRPLYSALDCQRFKDAFGLSLPPWQTGLELAFEELYDVDPYKSR